MSLKQERDVVVLLEIQARSGGEDAKEQADGETTPTNHRIRMSPVQIPQGATYRRETRRKKQLLLLNRLMIELGCAATLSYPRTI